MADTQTLFVYTTRCQGCGALHTTSQLFDHSPYNTPPYKPALSRDPTIGLVKTAINSRSTPICHSCADATQFTAEALTRWQDTIRRKGAEILAANRPKPPKPSHTPSTNRENLEDII